MSEVKNFGAQITFMQDDKLLNRDGSFREGRWIGTLLSREAIDRWTGHSNPKMICRITGPSILAEGGLDNLVPGPNNRLAYTHRYHLVTQGAHVGSRRYRTFRTLAEAQEAAIKWAARRFYVEVCV